MPCCSGFISQPFHDRVAFKSLAEKRLYSNHGKHILDILIQVLGIWVGTCYNLVGNSEQSAMFCNNQSVHWYSYIFRLYGLALQGILQQATGVLARNRLITKSPLQYR